MFTISSMKEYVAFAKEHCDMLVLTLPVDDEASPFAEGSDYKQIYERYPLTVVGVQER